MIDPVCGMTVNKKDAEVKSIHAGKAYYFCSEACKAKFDHSPDEILNGTGADFGEHVGGERSENLRPDDKDVKQDHKKYSIMMICCSGGKRGALIHVGFMIAIIMVLSFKPRFEELSIFYPVIVSLIIVMVAIPVITALNKKQGGDVSPKLVGCCGGHVTNNKSEQP